MGIRARVTSVSPMGRRAARSSSVPHPDRIDVRCQLDRGCWCQVAAAVASSVRRIVLARAVAASVGCAGTGPAAGAPAAAAAAKTPISDPEHTGGTGRSTQLEDGHGRQGEGESGQRGQQPESGIERGQVGLRRLAVPPVPGSSTLTTGNARREAWDPARWRLGWPRPASRRHVRRPARRLLTDLGPVGHRAGLVGDRSRPRPRRASRAPPSPGPGRPW